eukprot:CAMPEP_0115525784 /NCGR_PEP_ID=MMETSP0271-20121206/81934_1 /TAXON_ID=71861 /ORGANISM="Scrippsiella trochoidea, Strain CCMP3099" /LENGTH=64 /DNA_ID=CAMNT_0002957445 /DNA_START=42 /DNA_END=234 /DNA_ORIENTATION=+
MHMICITQSTVRPTMESTMMSTTKQVQNPMTPDAQAPRAALAASDVGAAVPAAPDPPPALRHPA